MCNPHDAKKIIHLESESSYIDLDPIKFESPRASKTKIAPCNRRPSVVKSV